MANQTTATHDVTAGSWLIGNYGPLMSIADVAKLLDRSVDGLRVALYTDNDVSRRLKPTMVRIGRRVYFRTLQVIDALRLDDSNGGGIA